MSYVKSIGLVVLINMCQPVTLVLGSPMKRSARGKSVSCAPCSSPYPALRRICCWTYMSIIELGVIYKVSCDCLNLPLIQLFLLMIASRLICPTKHAKNSLTKLNHQITIWRTSQCHKLGLIKIWCIKNVLWSHFLPNNKHLFEEKNVLTLRGS